MYLKKIFLMQLNSALSALLFSPVNKNVLKYAITPLIYNNC